MTRAFFRDTRGAAAAEFALVVPLFILLVFSTINMGFAMSAIIRLHHATEWAARCLSVDRGGSCAGDLTTDVNARFPIGGMSDVRYTPSKPACGNQVAGTGTYNVFTGLNTISFNISARACYPLI